jgi:hypothetical protein
MSVFMNVCNLGASTDEANKLEVGDSLTPPSSQVKPKKKVFRVQIQKKSHDTHKVTIGGMPTYFKSKLRRIYPTKDLAVSMSLMEASTAST